MREKKKNEFIQEVNMESFLSEDELDYFRIIDEETGEVEEEIELYDGYITLISSGVNLSHKIKKKANSISDKISISINSNKIESLSNEFIKVMAKGLICNRTISEHVMDLYDYCEKSNRFWHNCSIKVYKSYYPFLKKTYLEKFKTTTELDFLKTEYEYFLRINSKKKIINSIHNEIKEKDRLNLIGYFSYLNADENEFFKTVTQRKLDFLSNRILELGYYVQFVKEKKELFLNLIPVKNEKSDFDKLEEKVVNKSQLPSFSLLERYELVCRFEIDKAIQNSNALKKEKNKLLALIMDCSIDNARKLLDNTYKSKDKQKNKERKANIDEKIDEFLYRNKIEINLGR